MSAGFDWRSYQRCFGQRPRLSEDLQAPWQNSPAFFVEDHQRICAAYHDLEDLSDWIGAPVDEVADRFENRDYIILSKSNIDRVLTDSLSENHYFDQVSFLKRGIIADLNENNESSSDANRSIELLSSLEENHFLFDGVRSWWKRILPKRFVFYLRLTGTQNEEALLEFHQGILVGCERADNLDIRFNDRDSLYKLENRVKDLKRLSVLILVVSRKNWEMLTSSEDPWRLLSQQLRTKDAQIYPRKWSVLTGIALRGYLGL